MNKFSFEVHIYAPELNKVFYKGVDISKMFTSSLLIALSKDYNYNCNKVRFSLQCGRELKKFIFVAIRPNGTIEKKFYCGKKSTEIIRLFKQFKCYYNVEGTTHKIEIYK